MGDNGQGTSNGSGGGTQRTPTAIANLSEMQALAAKSGAAADRMLAGMLTDAVHPRFVKVDKNQQDTDTQRFVNATGIADKKPKIAKSEQELEAMKARGETTGKYLYHTDTTTMFISDAKVFFEQYKKGRMYLSSGVFGDGTYYSTSSAGSWIYGYGRSGSYQFKGMMNSNARVIDYSKLTKQITAFKKSHPKAAGVISRMSTGYGGRDGQKTVYALLFGYNVIRKNVSGARKQDYMCVIDRSAMTVAKKGIRPNETWEY